MENSIIESPKVMEAIEDIQEAIVEAGGCFLRRADVEDMRVVQLLRILLANGVSVKIEYDYNASEDSSTRITKD